MSTLLALLVTAASACSGPGGTCPGLNPSILCQSRPVPATPESERMVLHKDGGPGRGPDQPYAVREEGAKDLEGFVGGKQVVFVSPYDFFLVVLLAAFLVILIIAV